jgi:hypothetical protein
VAELASYLDRLTKKQLIIAITALALDKGIDLATGGALNKMTKKAVLAVGSRLLPVAGRAGLSVGGTALGVSRLVMTNPYVLGATALYVGYHERERIKQLLDQGYEIVREEAVDPLLELTAPGRQELFETMQPRPAPFIPGIIEQFRPKRKPSAFNRAVSAGMKAIKKSTSYGKKGTIKPAKKAFALVTKLAAAKIKKKKAPKSGIRRRIWNAMKGLR